MLKQLCFHRDELEKCWLWRKGTEKSLSLNEEIFLEWVVAFAFLVILCILFGGF